METCIQKLKKSLMYFLMKKIWNFFQLSELQVQMGIKF